MRNRFLMALCLAVLVSLGFAPRADAGLKWVWEPLLWRESTNTGPNASRGYEDSSMTISSTTTQPGHADTSASFPLYNWALPKKLSVAAVDTTLFGMISYQKAPTQPSPLIASGDSAAIVMQVSNDGLQWTTWGTPTQVFVASGFGPGGAFTNAILLDGQGTTSAGACTYPIRQNYLATGGVSNAASGAAPTPYQLFGWKLARVIIISDNTGAFELHAGHWVED